MTLRTSCMHFLRHSTAIVLVSALFACATAPAHTSSLVPGEQATFEGRIVGVDTNPWAYDGNAVVTVATANGGTVQVQLPARWNLCKAEAPGDVQALRPGDRVQVGGTVTEAGTVVVCEQLQHHLRKVD
jgi:hypothetical protein